MKRTTIKELGQIVGLINRISGTPVERSIIAGNRFTSNKGHYFLDFEGVNFTLKQVTNICGDCQDILVAKTKGTLKILLYAYLFGVQSEQSRKGILS